jgi:hypothetical protein
LKLLELHRRGFTEILFRLMSGGSLFGPRPPSHRLLRRFWLYFFKLCFAALLFLLIGRWIGNYEKRCAVRAAHLAADGPFIGLQLAAANLT